MGLLSPVIRNYLGRHAEKIRGRLLDIGCGNLPYRDLFSHVSEYVGIDREIRFNSAKPSNAALIIGSIEILPFKNGTFDAILSTQVIEHIPEPTDFFKEVSRVLKPQGKGIITFPLVNPLHELPHDYYRYTEHAICYLCNQHRLAVDLVVPMGGGWTTVGFILHYFLFNTGNRQFTARYKAILHRTGQLIFHLFQRIDKMFLFPELPVNYLMVFQKE